MASQYSGHIVFVAGFPQTAQPWKQQCSWYRVIGPGQALNRHGFRVDFLLIEQAGRIGEILGRHPVNGVILHRGSDGPQFERLRAETANAHVPLFYDLDDNVIDEAALEDARHLRNLSSAQCRGIRDWVRTNIDCLSQCDGALLATDELCRVASRHNPQARVARNFLPDFYIGDGRPRSRRATEKQLRIFYGPGSLEHGVYIGAIADSIARVMQRFKETVLFLGGGLPVPHCLKRFRDRVIVIPKLQPEIYFRTLACMDVAIAPLPADLFSSSKSWVKVLEAAANGCVWVASATPEYSRFSSLTGSGVLAGDAEWTEKLTGVVQDFGRLQTEAIERYPGIRRGFSMEANVGEYLKQMDLQAARRAVPASEA